MLCTKIGKRMSFFLNFLGRVNLVHPASRGGTRHPWQPADYLYLSLKVPPMNGAAVGLSPVTLRWNEPKYSLKHMFSKCALNFLSKYVYRGREKSLQILISYSQAGPGRKAKQGQEEISCNHVPTFFLGSVHERGHWEIGKQLQRGK